MSEHTARVTMLEQAIAQDADVSTQLRLAETLCKTSEAQPVIGTFNHAIATHGNPSTMCALALLLSRRPGRTAADERVAVDLLHHAAHQRHPRACAELGLVHHTGWGPCPRNDALAIELFETSLAVGPIASALYYLASIRLHGYEHAPPDPVYAIGLLERAIAECGDTESMVFLATLLSGDVTGVRKDHAHAVYLLSAASEQGHADAAYRLACLHLDPIDGSPRDPVRAAQLFQTAVHDHGHVGAMYKLAVMLRSGFAGTKPDPRLAASLLRRAVGEGSHYAAMAELALLLRSGEGCVPQDNGEATALLSRIDSAIQRGPSTGTKGAAEALRHAAAHGDCFALVTLAGHHKYGDPPFAYDVSSAKTLLQEAVNRQSAEAMFRLALLLIDECPQGRNGSEQVSERAIALLNRAVEEGDHVAAINLLASFYSDGFSVVEPDVRKAAVLYERGVHLGDAYSMNRLGLLYVNGSFPEHEGSVGKAVDLFERGVAKADLNAVCNLARLMRNGYGGVEANEMGAAELLVNQLEGNGHFRCLLAHADLRYGGFDGVAADRKHAASLVERAIALDDHDSMMLCDLLEKHRVEFGDLGDGSSDDGDIDMMERTSFFRLAIEHGGHPVVLYSIGCLVQGGWVDVGVDASAAARWFRRAIDENENDPLSLLALARLLLHGYDNVAADAFTAISLLQRAADLGHTEAMNLLGSLYTTGFADLPRNASAAVRCFQRAITQGQCEVAMVNLGCLLRDGYDDIAPDVPAAIALFERSIRDSGNVKAMTELGKILQRTTKSRGRAMRLFERVVDVDGSNDALFYLARLLQLGHDDVKPDIPRATAIYQHAVQNEQDVLSMYHLAMLLLQQHDQSGLQDAGYMPRVENLLQDAIDVGNHAPAMTMLAILLDAGHHLPQDTKKAMSLYRRAFKLDSYANTKIIAMICLAARLQQNETTIATKNNNIIETAHHFFYRAVNSRNNIDMINALIAEARNNVLRPQNTDEAIQLYERAIQLYDRGIHLSSSVTITANSND